MFTNDGMHLVIGIDLFLAAAVVLTASLLLRKEAAFDLRSGDEPDLSPAGSVLSVDQTALDWRAPVWRSVRGCLPHPDGFEAGLVKPTLCIQEKISLSFIPGRRASFSVTELAAAPEF